MARGQLVLPDGSRFSCDYALKGEQATLDLGRAFTAFGDAVKDAILELADGEHPIGTVVFRPRVGEATFSKR